MSNAERTDIEVSHRGKRYTLWRRGDNLYLRFKREGRATWKTLGTSIKELAVKQAKIELDALERHDWNPLPKKTQATTGYATIGEILDRLEKNAADIGISPRSVADYIHAMERFIVIATKRSDPRGVSSELLTDELVEKFIKRCRTVPMKAGDGTVKIRPDASIRSHLTQARAIFSKDKMSLYKGLTLPDLTKFKAASPSPKWASSRLGFTRFDKERVISMLEDAERLRLAKDPVWVCWAMMQNLAVRNKMVYQAKWSDFSEEAGEIVFTTRGDYREAITIRIAVRPQLWQQLLEFKSSTPIAEDENAAYVVPARHQTERHDICYKLVNRFFERHIPTPKGSKKAYQLRGQAASITFKYQGIDAAMQLLGHKHASTTLNNYAEHLRESQGVNPSDHASFYGITPPPPPPTPPTP
jgi:integrase